MAITPLKALLFLAGASTAAGATAYVAGAFDPYLGNGTAAGIASLPAGEPKVDAAKPQTPDAKADPAKPEAKVAAVDPASATAAPAAAEPKAPAFDLLRVEPDGSIVIAGSAMPNSSVEVISGSKVLGTVAAGPEGDFVAVLEEPLKPGDYQIVLRSNGPGAIAVNSVETAVVSVPTDKNGQVLALVEQPGAPSKLITLPAAAEPKPADVATATPPAGEPAATPPAVKPIGTGGAPTIAVEAVEIEGRKIFVAGAALAGSTVRGYVNDIVLGEAKTSPEGRFLIETERDLKVGDYIVRVDVLSPDGSKVVARAAVPFQREPGEAVAAVAPPIEAAPQPAAPAEQPAAPVKTGQPTAAAPAQPAPNQPLPETPGEQAEAAAELKPALPAGQSTTAETPAVEPSKPAAPTNGPAEAGSAAEALAGLAAGATAPKLQAADGGVIIRRGDSLWRISKRVYGRGMRFSTIYLANKEQIRNPDLIWPGQVFRVPDKTDEGEAADMKAMEGQATTVQ